MSAPYQAIVCGRDEEPAIESNTRDGEYSFGQSMLVQSVDALYGALGEVDPQYRPQRSAHIHPFTILSDRLGHRRGPHCTRNTHCAHARGRLYHGAANGSPALHVYFSEVVLLAR